MNLELLNNITNIFPPTTIFFIILQPVHNSVSINYYLLNDFNNGCSETVIIK